MLVQGQTHFCFEELKYFHPYKWELQAKWEARLYAGEKPNQGLNNCLINFQSSF